MSEERKGFFGHWCGKLAQHRVCVAENQKAELNRLVQIGDEATTNRATRVIQKCGYRVEIHGETPQKEKVRVFDIDPDQTTVPMRLASNVSERRRFLISGQAALVTTNGADYGAWDLSDCDVRLPVVVKPESVAFMFAGRNGARVLDLTPLSFDPANMEKQVSEEELTQLPTGFRRWLGGNGLVNPSG